MPHIVQIKNVYLVYICIPEEVPPKDANVVVSSLTYDWQPLGQMITDLKSLNSKNIDSRISALESNSSSGNSSVDTSGLDSRITALEGQNLDARVSTLEASAGLGNVDVTSYEGRIAALEAAVTQLSGQLLAYTNPQ